MEYEKGDGKIEHARKNLPSKSPVLLGLIYLQLILLNCKSTSRESRASELQVCHIAICQRVVSCKPTGCKFTTLRVSTCERASVRVANLKVNNFQRCGVNLGRIKCILKSMPSIFLILYSKILHTFIFLSDIYSAVLTYVNQEATMQKCYMKTVVLNILENI